VTAFEKELQGCWRLLVAFSALAFYSHYCEKLAMHELLAAFWLSSGQQLHEQFKYCD
jgi:hypothetical protein